MGRFPASRFSPASRTILPALLPALLAFAPGPAAAQVRINEILPNPTGDDVGTERIEIYNAGASSVDLTGWAIDDAATHDVAAVRCRIPEDFDTSVCSSSAVIGPGEFRVIKGTTTAAFLNNSGDDVYLTSDRLVSATVVHFVHYGDAALHVDSVWAAVPNGSDNFDWRANTMCASNGGSGDATAPATVTDLAAVPGDFPGEVRLAWTAPGDDGASGTASEYVIKVSTSPINSGNFAAATDLNYWINEPLPSVGGTAETLVVFGMDTAQTWYFALMTLDEIPNASDVSNSPSTAPHAGAGLDPDLGYNAYFGNLHSHTSYSDGVQTPPDAYNFARNTAPTPLDFLAVTDHNHVSAGMSLPDYHLGLSQAASANDDGSFVAIYGQEWGVAANGHVNVFEAPVLFGWDGGNYDVFVAQNDYTSLYTAVLANPPASYPAIAEWCHPGLTDFDNLAATNDGKAAVRLMCMVNGPSTSTKTDESDIGNTGFDAAFNNALLGGMRVSPTGDQDNHNATWGAATESRTAVLANAKTKSEILSAMAARRTYATQDHNVQVAFSAEGHAMGEAFSSTDGIRIAAQVDDPDPLDSVAEISLYRGVTGTSLATRVAWNVNHSTFSWRDLAAIDPDAEVHYYLRIRMADNQNVWTGPVYVTYPSTPTSVDGRPGSGLRLAVGPNPAPGHVTASFALPGAAGRATLAVYDPAGRRVRTLVDGPLGAGEHHATWDGRLENGGSAAAGIFFLRLDTPAGRLSRKVLLLR